MQRKQLQSGERGEDETATIIILSIRAVPVTIANNNFKSGSQLQDCWQFSKILVKSGAIARVTIIRW